MSGYHRALTGPRLEAPFTVLSGLVVVIGDLLPLRLPPGATWPGHAALPEWMAERARPALTQRTPGTQVTAHVTPRDIESGLALVHAQLLCTGALTGRLEVLEYSVHPREVCQTTVAALIGTSRETVTSLLGRSYPRTG